MKPEIKFVAFISRAEKPLYLQSFEDNKPNASDYLKYNFLSHMALDIFASPTSLNLKEQQKLNDSDALLLFIQDGISVYGFETNTNLKIVVGQGQAPGHREGAPAEPEAPRPDPLARGTAIATLNTFISQIHKAYLRAICNPFANLSGDNEAAFLQTSKFDAEIKRLVAQWRVLQ